MTSAREQSRGGRVRALVRQYPTTTFFLVTFLITWAAWLPNVFAQDSFAGTVAPYWTYMPAVAAVMVAAIVGSTSRPGCPAGPLASRLALVRVVLIGPAAFYAVVAALQVGFGWSAEPDQPNAMRAALIGLLPYFLLFVLTDGLGEEPGWRGFALPRMLERSGPMLASLVLGVMSALHHLPLFWTVGRRLYGESFLILLVELPAMSVLYTSGSSSTPPAARFSRFRSTPRGALGGPYS